MVSGCFCPQEGKNRGGLPGSRYRAWAGFRLHGEASVRWIWRQHSLKPHLIQTFKLSRDQRLSRSCRTSSGST
jgi:hypothetical protein